MPLYEYACEDCKVRSNELRGVPQRHAPLRCAACKGSMKLLMPTRFALKTDTTFLAGVRGDGCRNDATRKALRANAKRMGVSVSGKQYDGRVARFRGDPMACYDTRAEAAAAVARTGQCSAELGVKPRPDETTGKPYRLADDIVEKRVQKIADQEHGGTLTKKQHDNLSAEVREKHEPADGVAA